MQIHDFNPGITESGLFWTIPISENTISVNFAAGKAAFQASNVDVEDYHDVVNALLDGVEVDYVETLEGAGFKFNNPNVKSTCGCGSSFSV